MPLFTYLWCTYLHIFGGHVSPIKDMQIGPYFSCAAQKGVPSGKITSISLQLSETNIFFFFVEHFYVRTFLRRTFLRWMFLRRMFLRWIILRCTFLRQNIFTLNVFTFNIYTSNIFTSNIFTYIFSKLIFYYYFFIFLLLLQYVGAICGYNTVRTH